MDHDVNVRSQSLKRTIADEHFSNIMTNEQKKEWFLRLDPNGTTSFCLNGYS